MPIREAKPMTSTCDETKTDDALADTATRQHGWTTTTPLQVDRPVQHHTWDAAAATINASIVLISLPAIFRGMGSTASGTARATASYMSVDADGYLVVRPGLCIVRRSARPLSQVKIYKLVGSPSPSPAWPHFPPGGAPVADWLARGPRAARC